ncbi:hypothetical protein CBM2615_B180049 [Cupriavidus taiwanensis]|nr:hypothetical protein CBM2615_B180049 [Cupriavidus taiwanensis]
MAPPCALSTIGTVRAKRAWIPRHSISIRTRQDIHVCI